MAKKNAQKTVATKNAKREYNVAKLAENVAALRKVDVKHKDNLTIPLSPANAWLLHELNEHNRVAIWPHTGQLAKSMRVFDDSNNPDRYIGRATTVTVGETRGTTDGANRLRAAILAFGSESDVKRLCIHYGITRTVKDDDGKEYEEADVAKLSKMTKLEFYDVGGNWLNQPRKDYPLQNVSVGTDDHYFMVADQTQRKRTGGDMLYTTPHVANELASHGMDAKMAESVLRLTYLRCLRSITGDATKFGSVKRGGNIPANRFTGFFDLFGKSMLQAWKQYVEVVHNPDLNGAFNRSHYEKVGVVNILVVLTVARLGHDLKLKSYITDDTSGHELTDDEERLGYTALRQWDALAVGKRLESIGYATTGKGASSNVDYFVQECIGSNRMGVKDKIACLCDVLGYDEYTPDSKYSGWSKVFISALQGEGEYIDTEQLYGLRWYGPDSTGLSANQKNAIVKGASVG